MVGESYKVIGETRLLYHFEVRNLHAGHLGSYWAEDWDGVFGELQRHGFSLTDLNLQGAILEGEVIRNKEFVNCFFGGVTMNECRMVNCKFIDCSFVGAVMYDAQTDDSVFVRCDFTGCTPPPDVGRKHMPPRASSFQNVAHTPFYKRYREVQLHRQKLREEAAGLRLILGMGKRR